VAGVERQGAVGEIERLNQAAHADDAPGIRSAGALASCLSTLALDKLQAAVNEVETLQEDAVIVRMLGDYAAARPGVGVNPVRSDILAELKPRGPLRFSWPRSVGAVAKQFRRKDRQAVSFRNAGHTRIDTRVGRLATAS
jgi:hypothetical protein